jgi:hypothetical protein
MSMVIASVLLYPSGFVTSASAFILALAFMMVLVLVEAICCNQCHRYSCAARCLVLVPTLELEYNALGIFVAAEEVASSLLPAPQVWHVASCGDSLSGLTLNDFDPAASFASCIGCVKLTMNFVKLILSTQKPLAARYFRSFWFGAAICFESVGKDMFCYVGTDDGNGKYSLCFTALYLRARERGGRRLCI